MFSLWWKRGVPLFFFLLVFFFVLGSESVIAPLDLDDCRNFQCCTDDDCADGTFCSDQWTCATCETSCPSGRCGTWTNSCGETITCGSCPGDQVCSQTGSCVTPPLCSYSTSLCQSIAWDSCHDDDMSWCNYCIDRIQTQFYGFTGRPGVGRCADLPTFGPGQTQYTLSGSQIRTEYARYSSCTRRPGYFSGQPYFYDDVKTICQQAGYDDRVDYCDSITVIADPDGPPEGSFSSTDQLIVQCHPPTPPPQAILRVESSNPNSGVTITRVGGESGTGGTTSYDVVRDYSFEAEIEAPAEAPNGNEFSHWNGCDTWQPWTRVCIVIAERGDTKTVTAVYTTPSVVNGECGTNEDDYLCEDTQWPSTSSTAFCSSGTLYPGTPDFPESGSAVTWWCLGSDDGSNVQCTARREECTDVPEPSCSATTPGGRSVFFVGESATFGSFFEWEDNPSGSNFLMFLDRYTGSSWSEFDSGSSSASSSSRPVELRGSTSFPSKGYYFVRGRGEFDGANAQCSSSPNKPVEVVNLPTYDPGMRGSGTSNVNVDVFYDHVVSAPSTIRYRWATDSNCLSNPRLSSCNPSSSTSYNNPTRLTQTQEGTWYLCTRGYYGEWEEWSSTTCSGPYVIEEEAQTLSCCVGSACTSSSVIDIEVGQSVMFSLSAFSDDGCSFFPGFNPSIYVDCRFANSISINYDSARLFFPTYSSGFSFTDCPLVNVTCPSDKPVWDDDAGECVEDDSGAWCSVTGLTGAQSVVVGDSHSYTATFDWAEGPLTTILRKRSPDGVTSGFGSSTGSSTSGSGHTFTRSTSFDEPGSWTVIGRGEVASAVCDRTLSVEVSCPSGTNWDGSECVEDLVCSCSWSYMDCGEGGCGSDEILRVYTCNSPSCTGHGDEECVFDSACDTCSCTSWVDQGCGAGGCPGDMMHQTRSCSPSGCNIESRCVSDSSCAAGGPDPFSFNNVNNAPLSSRISSNVVTPTGYSGTLTAVVTGSGSARLVRNGGSESLSVQMSPGDNLQVRLTSSSSYSTTRSATVTMGDVTTTWYVTTGGCTPTSCSAEGVSCGTISDGCGGTLNCGGCPDYCASSNIRRYSGSCDVGGSCVYNSQDCSSLNGWLGNEYCSGNDVWDTYRTYSCSGGSCVHSDSQLLKEECAYGCSGGSCFECDPNDICCDVGGSFLDSNTRCFEGEWSCVGDSGDGACSRAREVQYCSGWSHGCMGDDDFDVELSPEGQVCQEVQGGDDEFVLLSADDYCDTSELYCAGIRERNRTVYACSAVGTCYTGDGLSVSYDSCDDPEEFCLGGECLRVCRIQGEGPNFECSVDFNPSLTGIGEYLDEYYEEDPGDWCISQIPDLYSPDLPEPLRSSACCPFEAWGGEYYYAHVEGNVEIWG